MSGTAAHISPNAKSFRRFMRNRSAVAGLIIILLSVFIALFAYYLAPDHSTNADEQILQLEMHAPGFSIDMLKVLRDKPFKKTGFLDRLIDGTPGVYEWIPFLSYRFEGKDIVLQEYKGKGFPPKEKRIALADVVYARSLNGDSVHYSGNRISFKDIDQKDVNVSIAELQSTIQKDHLTHKCYYLGTDKFGRDILSRMILGVRVSLTVGLVSVLISFIIGLILGSVAGYFGGATDKVVMWFITVFWSIPTFLLAMGLALSVEGSKYLMIYVAVGLTMWVDMARIVRQQFMSMREMQFVEAAQSLGYSHFRTITKHILPNIIGPVIVVMAADFAGAILIEAGLSFLGLGVQPPKPSWGQMLNEYRDFLNTDKAYLTIIPGIAIMLLVLAFNLIGNGLRDALDVKTRITEA